MASLLPHLPHENLSQQNGRPSRPPVVRAALQAQEKPVQDAPAVTARVRYVKPPPPGEVLHSHVYELPEGAEPDNLFHVPTEVSITNLRQTSQSFSILENGFQLIDFSVPSDIDWESNKEVRCYALPWHRFHFSLGGTLGLVQCCTFRPTFLPAE